MSKLKNLLKRIIKEEVSKALLSEAFTSSKLAQLDKILKKEGESIAVWNVFAKEFGVEPSKIPDNAVEIKIPSPEIIKSTKYNKDLITFWVDDTRLLGIIKDGGWAELKGSKWDARYYTDFDDPKHMRSDGSYKRSGGWVNTNLRKSSQSQQSAEYQLSRKELVDQSKKVYVIDIQKAIMQGADSAAKMGARNAKWEDPNFLTTMSQLRNRFKEKVKQFKANKRDDDNLPEGIRSLQAQVEDISGKILLAVDKVMKNPEKMTWGKTYFTQYYGSSRRNSSTKYGLLELYADIVDNINNVIEEWKKGNDRSYYYSQVITDLKRVEKILGQIDRASAR